MDDFDYYTQYRYDLVNGAYPEGENLDKDGYVVCGNGNRTVVCGFDHWSHQWSTSKEDEYPFLTDL